MKAQLSLSHKGRTLAGVHPLKDSNENIHLDIELLYGENIPKEEINQLSENLITLINYRGFYGAVRLFKAKLDDNPNDIIIVLGDSIIKEISYKKIYAVLNKKLDGLLVNALEQCKKDYVI